MSEAWVILGNQQFPIECLQFSPARSVYMAEDFGLCSFQKHHKQKILLFIASMRHYSEELRRSGFHVTYKTLEQISKSSSYEDNLLSFVRAQKISTLHMFQIEDHFFETRLLEFAECHKVEIRFYNSPMFLVPREKFVNYLETSKKPFMAKFYQLVREDLGIMVDSDGNPEGGKWSFDTENRKRLPKDHQARPSLLFPANEDVKLVKKIVHQHFADHPGSLEDDWLPLCREQALEQFDDFLKHKIHSFGEYQDAMDPTEPFLYHSLMSVSLNMGWVLPHEVVEKTLEFKRKQKLPLNSVEGFLRQVIGWREFVRGIYHNFDDEMSQANFFGHKRKMKDCWYLGKTGLPPVDDAILRAIKYGYNHHIERLMILSNVMLLSELEPCRIYKWFMEMYVDSSDWVMAANVYGMGQFSEGGIFATKPYISGSNYIRKQSYYPKGDWCDEWDGLYWRFIEQHHDFFAKNPRLSMMVRTLDKMKSEKKNRIFAAAQNFLDRTSTP